MNMFRPLIVAILMLLFIKPLDAQETNSQEKRSAFGINLSNVSGTGLAYRTFMHPTTSAQFTGGFISIDGKSAFSLGTEIMFRLARLESIDVPIGPALSAYGDSDTETNIRLGLGLGLDFRTSEDVTTNYFLVTLRLYYPAIFSRTGNVGPGAGMGLMIVF